MSFKMFSFIVLAVLGASVSGVSAQVADETKINCQFGDSTHAADLRKSNAGQEIWYNGFHETFRICPGCTIDKMHGLGFVTPAPKWSVSEDEYSVMQNCNTDCTSFRLTINRHDGSAVLWETMNMDGSDGIYDAGSETFRYDGHCEKVGAPVL